VSESERPWEGRCPPCLQGVYTERLRALDECRRGAAAARRDGDAGCVAGAHWRALLGNVEVNLPAAEKVTGPLCERMLRKLKSKPALLAAYIC
jgi:hypothetical protein